MKWDQFGQVGLGIAALLLKYLVVYYKDWLTRDREATGSSLAGVTALWSLSKTHLS